MTNVNKVQELFTKKHFINLITCIIIWISGVTFIYKYFDKPAPKIFFYSIIFPIVLILIGWTEKYYKSFLTKDILFLAMLIVTAAEILLYRFDYIGYPSIVAFSILWLLIIYYSQNVKTSLIQLAVFLLSPVLYSELISFSGIFALAMLIILSIFISERFLENNKLDWKFFLIAFLFGATLSAGLWVGFIYIIYLLYVFRTNITKGLEFILIMVIAYALLLFLSDKGYITMAAVQTNYFQLIPNWIIILLLLATLYAGWIAAEFHEVLFASGVILFFIYILSFVFTVAVFGWNKDEFDFLLMMMAIPFLVLAIKEYKVDRFLGKVF